MHTKINNISERRDIKSPSWGQERRLEFIEFRLLWEGRINRGELVDFFGTSIQQASLDLARYMEIAPDNLEYNKREKVYRVTNKFRPALTIRDSQAFLNQLLGLTTGTLSPSLTFVGWRPPYDVVIFPTRSIRPEFLIRVIWAIRDKEEVEISYQSMRTPSASRRWIAPHAIAFDGSRWHVRAWCHEHGEFRDFVFARIQQIHGLRRSEVDLALDALWHTFVTIILRPRTGLTKHQSLAIEAEFGMKNGTLRIPIRKALVFYFARQLRIDREEEFPIAAQPIEWVNKNEFLPLLEAARK